MPNIAESWRFVAGYHIPIEPLWVSGSTAYAAMVKAEVGALIALDGQVPRFFIAARFVKSALDFAARKLDGPAASIIPLSAHLREYWTPNSELSDFVKASFSAAGQPVDYAIVEIDETTLLHSADESAGGKTIRQVLGPSGASMGWYLGHEATLGTIQTQPDSWLCTNKPAHSNANFDSGKCADCGWALIV